LLKSIERLKHEIIAILVNYDCRDAINRVSKSFDEFNEDELIDEVLNTVDLSEICSEVAAEYRSGMYEL
jgi:hypothetical protein